MSLLVHNRTSLLSLKVPTIQAAQDIVIWGNLFITPHTPNNNNKRNAVFFFSFFFLPIPWDYSVGTEVGSNWRNTGSQLVTVDCKTDITS